jgi:ABC-type lipoprotein release transport system permease subunit
LSFALTRLISGMLVGVHAMDPLSLSVTAALLFFSATAAALGPAWRAARVDPMRTLRADP